MSETTKQYKGLAIGAVAYVSQAKEGGQKYQDLPAVRVTRVPDGVIYTPREIVDKDKATRRVVDRPSFFVSFLELDAAERVSEKSEGAGSLLESVGELEAEIKKSAAEVVSMIVGGSTSPEIDEDLVAAIVKEMDTEEEGIVKVSAELYKMLEGKAKLQGEVATWQAETFPEATVESKIKHLEKEIFELDCARAEELEGRIPATSVLEEAADCAMLLFGIAALEGGNLLGEVQKKLEINRGRKWGEPDEDGVVEHIPIDEKDLEFIKVRDISDGLPDGPPPDPIPREAPEHIPTHKENLQELERIKDAIKHTEREDELDALNKKMIEVIERDQEHIDDDGEIR